MISRWRWKRGGSEVRKKIKRGAAATEPVDTVRNKQPQYNYTKGIENNLGICTSFN